MDVFCLSCPSATFAHQHGGFVPREWLPAKGLFGVVEGCTNVEHFIRTRKQRRILNDAGQPIVGFLHSWMSSLPNVLRKSSL